MSDESNFQKIINTEDEWEELIFNEGLQVIDVYQDWCGPCKPIVKFLWRLKTQLNDKILNFAIAKSNTIESLENYRGRCEPCFLIYGNGILVGVIRGCNPPSLEQLIKTKLNEEHLAIKGLGERIEIKDPFFKYMEELKLEEELAKDYEEVSAEAVLVIIKPGIVLENKVSEISSMILEKNMVILKEEERLMTEDEAEMLYGNIQHMDFYNGFIKYMTSDSCYFLILMKENNIINEFRELMGPKSLDEARMYYPESIRAKFGKSTMENAIHCAEDRQSCNKELLIFYPDFVAPLIKLRRDILENIQTTVAIIRPSGCQDFKERIVSCIIEDEFEILRQEEFKFTRNEAEKFYEVNTMGDYLEDLILEMIEGPFLVLLLTRKDAINRWRALLGSKDVSHASKYEPKSLRAMFSKNNIFVNLIHGSDSIESAEKELKYFFPIEQTIGAIKPDSFDNRDEILELINEFGFKISIMKEIILTKEQIDKMYPKERYKPFYSDLVRYMTGGKSLFLVLSKQDAIKEWRSVIGPTDPEIAVEENSDYLRALYGRDILENAIYGSSDKEEVNTLMKMIFGEVEFQDDGSLIIENETDLTPEEFEKCLKVNADFLVDEIIAQSKKRLTEEINIRNSDDGSN